MHMWAQKLEIFDWKFSQKERRAEVNEHEIYFEWPNDDTAAVSGI